MLQISLENRYVPDIIAQQKRNEDAWHDDVAQTEHKEVRAEHSVNQEILREDQFDWCLERLGNGNHNIGSEHPEDVVKEETAEQNAAVHNGVQVQQFDAVDREGQTEHIVCDPVLFPQIPGTEQGGEHQREQINGGELEVDQTVSILVGALGELKRVGLHVGR